VQRVRRGRIPLVWSIGEKRRRELERRGVRRRLPPQASRQARLDEVFQLQQARVVSADWVVRYHHAAATGTAEPARRPASSRVTVRENQQEDISIESRGQKLGFTQIAQRPPREAASDGVSPQRTNLRDRATSRSQPLPSPPAN